MKELYLVQNINFKSKSNGKNPEIRKITKVTVRGSLRNGKNGNKNRDSFTYILAYQDIQKK